MKEKCPTCGKDCGWMDRYLYRCKETLESEFYIPLFPVVNLD